jgi:hypothetical protein
VCVCMCVCVSSHFLVVGALLGRRTRRWSSVSLLYVPVCVCVCVCVCMVRGIKCN